MRHFGLIGYPLGHSLSADFFAEKFARGGVDAEYSLYPIGSIDEVLPLLKKLSGFNVTTPYKKEIIPLLDRLSEEAAAVGAVNCVKIMADGSACGYNTDVAGIRETLAGLGDLCGEKALVLGGSGGAAAAVKYVLNGMGVRCTSVSRTAGEGSIAYSELTHDVITEHTLIINATPLGMSPDFESCPDIPYEALTSAHTLFDLVYNPEVTEFLSRGARQGTRTTGGKLMFVEQAEASWRIWNG